MSNDLPPKVPRRSFLKGAMAASALTVHAHQEIARASETAPQGNAITRENALAGADDWQLTRVRVDGDGFRSPWIEGYCSRQSVSVGESIDVMVSTDPARSFRLELFRMGYYGGKGARLVKTLGPIKGITQPTPEPGEKALHECQWEPALRLTIPDNWPSGVYVGRLTTVPEGTEAYWQSHIVFVVRDDRPADILFQVSDNTWQAYNLWPNK
jgi:hypothetical protein